MNQLSNTVTNVLHSKRSMALAIIGVLLLACMLATAIYFSRRVADQPGQTVIQSHRTYNLHLMEGMTYAANKPTELMFNIRDENSKVLKNFDIVHEKVLHLIVVRKDRAYFQHVHPKFDAASGMFAITGFTFPTDGMYRVFADFTPSDSQTGPDGMKLAATPYQDVKVGNGTYTPQPLGEDKLTSDAGGLATALTLISDGSGPQPYANTPLTLGVTVSKNEVAYTNLQTYLGALGHMAVLGPNLEFIHAHAIRKDVNMQTGLITFMVTFPDPGQYKIYLQTQADGHVNTTGYNYTISPNPNGTSAHGSMQGMEHMGQ